MVAEDFTIRSRNGFGWIPSAKAQLHKQVRMCIYTNLGTHNVHTHTHTCTQMYTNVHSIVHTMYNTPCTHMHTHAHTCTHRCTHMYIAHTMHIIIVHRCTQIYYGERGVRTHDVQIMILLFYQLNYLASALYNPNILCHCIYVC